MLYDEVLLSSEDFSFSEYVASIGTLGIVEPGGKNSTAYGVSELYIGMFFNTAAWIIPHKDSLLYSMSYTFLHERSLLFVRAPTKAQILS